MAEPVSNDRFDRATDPEYAAVCPMAVLAVIVGVLGATAFLVAPLVAVPVVALVLGLAAHRKIRKSQGVLVGRKLALAGMVLGIATAALGGGYHLSIYMGEQRTLEDLKTQASEMIDDVLAGRYQNVFEKLPHDSVQRKVGLERFCKAMSDLFEGGGNLVQRNLRSLQILPTERGGLVAPAEMYVRLDRRTLQITLWFRQEDDGRWQFAGVGGHETFESIAKHAGQDSPAPLPAPYQRGHGHGHHHH